MMPIARKTGTKQGDNQGKLRWPDIPSLVGVLSLTSMGSIIRSNRRAGVPARDLIDIRNCGKASGHTLHHEGK